MIKTTTYTEPALCHHNHDLNKSWFVYFSFTDNETNQKKRLQFRGDINLERTKEGRIREGRRLLKFWKEELESGWSPFERVTTSNSLLDMNFCQTVDFAMSKCEPEVATDTFSCYKSTAKYIKMAAEALKLSVKPIAEIKRTHVKLILEQAKAANKWSNTSYNKHLNYLKCILKRAIDWEIIENNPAHKIPCLPVAETEKYVPYTEAEREAIQEYLYMHHYRFFVYLLVIYQTGIRPKEILALRIKNIDLINSQITIIPDLEAETSKTKKIRKVPISKNLLPFLRELGLQEYSRECFVFGSMSEPGKGNKGSGKGGVRGAMHPDYFKPSMVRIKRDTVTKFWKRIIIDKLGIQKHLYAAKHSGANSMIQAGIDLDTLKELFGHSSKLMTEKYASAVKKVRFNEIIEKAPAF